MQSHAEIADRAMPVRRGRRRSPVRQVLPPLRPDDPQLPGERANVLRVVARMSDAAERRDLGVGAGGFPFPPLRRTIRPMAPEAAAERWLERFLALGGHRNGGSGTAGSAEAEYAP